MPKLDFGALLSRRDWPSRARAIYASQGTSALRSAFLFELDSACDARGLDAHAALFRPGAPVTLPPREPFEETVEPRKLAVAEVERQPHELSIQAREALADAGVSAEDMP